ncbi:ATP-binding protein [Candidatus Gribaldobacteria bacterium]|nr:ATP-binding protein [Candidatus Gribaldobacteria bacterium]
MRGFAFDQFGDKLPQRNGFVLYQKYINDFYNKSAEPRWIIMPGLRGVGKTTLLAQIFLQINFSDVEKIFLPVDEIIKKFSVSLWDVFDVLEEVVLGKRIEELKGKIFIFLDEIQYEKQWDAVLKSLYDRSKNVFIFCTGSSSVLLRKQISADSARRAYFEELYPMSFTEFLKLKKNKFPEKGLVKKIKDTLFLSENVQQALGALEPLKPQVNRYWADIDQLEINRYLQYGTMPFTLAVKEEGVIYNQLDQAINRIIFIDLPQIKNFEREILNKIYRLLYAVSDGQQLSVSSVANEIGLNKDTLSLILDSLVKCGLLLRLMPYGSHIAQVRKPSKYLFLSPAFRMLFLSSKESIKDFDHFKGKLLEDTVGLVCYKFLRAIPGASLVFDVAAGGADFILKTNEKMFVVEVGFGNKDNQQIINTVNRIGKNKNIFSILISQREELEIADGVLRLPIKFFLLI